MFVEEALVIVGCVGIVVGVECGWVDDDLGVGVVFDEGEVKCEEAGVDGNDGARLRVGGPLGNEGDGVFGEEVATVA